MQNRLYRVYGRTGKKRFGRIKTTHTHIRRMKVQTTHDFLKSKLSNLRDRLLEQHGADGARVAQLEAHLLQHTNLPQYARSLKGRDLKQVAAEIAAFVGAPAAAGVVELYLGMFLSLTDNTTW